MKPNLRFVSAALLCVILTATACEKKDVGEAKEPDGEQLATHADDQSQFAIELNATANEAILSAEGSASFTGERDLAMPKPCTALVAFDSSGGMHTFTITYNGLNCFGTHTRSGVVRISKPKGAAWKSAGAAVTITFDNFRITRVGDGKSVVLNGIETIVNESGGLMRQLVTIKTVTHRVSGKLSITFDNGSLRTWESAQKRVFTWDNGVAVSITGNHKIGGDAGVAVWDTNRFGQAFTTSVTQPLTIKQSCNFRLTSGEVRHDGWATATVTYGLDALGVVAACPGNGKFYFRMAWTGPAGNTHSKLFAY